MYFIKNAQHNVMACMLEGKSLSDGQPFVSATNNHCLLCVRCGFVLAAWELVYIVHVLQHRFCGRHKFIGQYIRLIALFV